MPENHCVKLTLDMVNMEEFKTLLREALIEQDKKTRHACAEACMRAAEGWDGSGAAFDRCHMAVMNCTEGLKGLK